MVTTSLSKSLVFDAVTAYVDSRSDKQYRYISPSALGGCMRKHFFLLKGVTPTTPPSSIAKTNFAVGHLWEEFIARALDHASILVKHYQDGVDEPFVLEELRLAGTPDMLIDVDGTHYVVDSKTVRSEWFQYRKRAGEEAWLVDNKPYVMQIGAYIMLLRRAGILVDNGILAFASKDDGYVGLELMVELTPELEAEIVERCRTLIAHLDADTLPPCECAGWKVGYCDFGNAATRKENTKHKMVNTECCSDGLWENFHAKS